MPDLDSVYLFSSHIPVSGLPPSHKWVMISGFLQKIKYTDDDPFIPGIHATVRGCSLVNRDLLREHHVLDPNGDQPYAIEIKYGTAVSMRRCYCKLHEGERRLPAGEFPDNGKTCQGCLRKQGDTKRSANLKAEPIPKPKWSRASYSERVAKTGTASKVGAVSA